MHHRFGVLIDCPLHCADRVLEDMFENRMVHVHQTLDRLLAKFPFDHRLMFFKGLALGLQGQ